MSWLDGLLLAVILWGGWQGWRYGLVHEVTQTGGALIGLAVAYRVAPGVATRIHEAIGLPVDALQIVIFLAIALAITLLGVAVAPRFARWFSVGRCRAVNQWGGVLTGALKSLLVLFVLVVAASAVPWPAVQRHLAESTVALWMLRTAPQVYEGALLILPDAARTL